MISGIPTISLPAPRKRGTFYVLHIVQVTGSTEPYSKVITPHWGGGQGRRKGGRGMGDVIILRWSVG